MEGTSRTSRKRFRTYTKSRIETQPTEMSIWKHGVEIFGTQLEMMESRWIQRR
ncbi:9550_t:CDS:1, partial [Entrophospora sp. SA101]